MARRLGVVVVMVVVVALLVWAGVHNLRQRRLAMQQARQAQVTLSKDDSATEAQMMGMTLEGKAAPAFALFDVKGKKVSLADFKGHPVVVNFWATYCGPCKLEMPWFEQMRQKYEPQGLVVLGLDQEDGVTKQDVTTAAQHVGVTYPILLSDDKVAKDYGLGDYLPETYYIDRSGKVVAQTIGAHSRDELEADILKATAGGA